MRNKPHRYHREHAPPSVRPVSEYFKSHDNLHRRLGLTKTAYQSILESQGGGCKICGSVPDARLAVDHCHETGNFRGLLCSHCNVALGLFGDNPERLRRAAKYLEDNPWIFD